MNCRSTLLFVLLAMCVLSFTVANTSLAISKQVMDQLDDLYSNKPIEEKLKHFTLPKMITLLSGNEAYRNALENTADNKAKFTDVAHYIIDEEMAKSKWSIWDAVGTLGEGASAIYGWYGLYEIYKANPDAVQNLSKFLKKKLGL